MKKKVTDKDVFDKNMEASDRIHDLNTKAEHINEHIFARSDRHKVGFDKMVEAFELIGTYEHAIMDACTLIAGYCFKDDRFLEAYKKGRISLDDVIRTVALNMARMWVYYNGAES